MCIQQEEYSDGIESIMILYILKEEKRIEDIQEKWIYDSIVYTYK